MSFGLLASCAAGADAQAGDPAIAPTPRSAPSSAPTATEAPLDTAVPPETSLAIADVGIWADLDPRVALPAPRGLASGVALIDEAHQLLIIYDERERPHKAYPIGGDGSLRVGDESIALRPGDAAELAPLAARLRLERLARGAEPPGGDADGDGIPNRLDVLIGAQKTILNGAAYGAGYIKLEYPAGDVPREVGVCSDVIIRAVRNAGIDLQSELFKDIHRAKRAYPMVAKRNAHIDHRRVKTLLPYFRRHWDERAAAIDSAADPLEPGDVVFMDTFPNRPGPDHIGIVGTNRGASGHPMIINNWTDGSVTDELDLLHFVPVTNRFRIK